MNYQSPYQSPLNSMSYQFQNMGIQGSPHVHGTTLNGISVDPALSGPQALSRTTSLLDSIGNQRSSSPFVTQQQQAGSSLVNGWGHNVAAESHLHETASSSPYPSHLGTPSLVGSNTNLLGAASQPLAVQGLAMPAAVEQPSLHVVLESQWRYIDTQGQIQGPFGSVSMSQWYASGYFQHTLQISRVGTSLEPFGINDRFITLGELISKVNDFQNPFGTFDRLVASAAAATSVAAPAVVPSGNASMNNDMLQHHLATQSTQKQPPVAKVQGSDYTHNEILQLKDDEGGYYHEVVVQIPVSKRKLEKLDSVTEIDTSVPNGKFEVSSIESGSNDAGKNVLKEVQGSQPQQSIPPHPVEPVKSQTDKAKEIELKRQQKAEEMAKRLLEEQQRQDDERKEKEELRKLKKQQKQKTKQQEEVESKVIAKNQASDEGNVIEAQITIESSAPKASPVPKTPLAPWANITKNVETPKISIPELQRKGELEQAKRDQERERLERAAALKLQEDILREEKAQKDLKSVLTWASKPPPPLVTVDIKPQKKAVNLSDANKKKKKATESPSIEALDQFNDPDFIKEQKTLWETAQRDKAKRQASTTSTTTYTTANDNEWTTITSKSTSTGTNQPKVINQPKSYISPDKLRAVGGTSNKQIGSSISIPSLKAKHTGPVMYPGNNSISVRQEFLRWCRSQMKLGPSVEVNSVLEVLLSLPAGPEAKEIIADTIYSNSSTMDGRRFATEFIKRRIECEKLVKDPLTWSEALALPEGNEDDWEFQVVSKKKGRKHRAD